MHTPIALDSYHACTEFPRPMQIVVPYMHTYIHAYIHAYKHTYNWLHLDIRHNTAQSFAQYIKLYIQYTYKVAARVIKFNEYLGP